MAKLEVFAAGTRVPVMQTRMELESLLSKHKARALGIFTDQKGAVVVFEMADRRIKFALAVPPEGGSAKQERQRREKWRALLLAIKAKLVGVQSGIESFEEAFMAHVVMPDGRTVGELTRPAIASAYKEGKMVPLLPGPSAN